MDCELIAPAGSFEMALAAFAAGADAVYAAVGEDEFRRLVAYAGPDRRVLDAGESFPAVEVRGVDFSAVAKAKKAGLPLKILGINRNPLYASVATAWYRAEIDGVEPPVTENDFLTVLSGAPLGEVKRVTRDRDGLAWVRVHLMRALEKHDGVQFQPAGMARRTGFGVHAMRRAISRVDATSAREGDDVELLVPEGLVSLLREGTMLFVTLSNALKRKFPKVAYRESDYKGPRALDVTVSIFADRIEAVGVAKDPGELSDGWAETYSVEERGEFGPAKNPEKTEGAVRKAFERLGGTDCHLGELVVNDPERRFAPMSALNALRRKLMESVEG